MCLLRKNLPNLCPNIDAVDFSECHSEEVISFFWRSASVVMKKDTVEPRYKEVGYNKPS